MAKYRDLKFDNLRGLAIFLVVLGHFIGATLKIGFPSEIVFSFIYKGIYVFHMPLLIFISGYFSKVEENGQVKAFRNILIPFILFDILFVLFRLLIFHENVFSTIFFYPSVGLWYLLSLYLWRTFLPSLTQIKHVILISILLSLFVGTINIKGGFLSFERTLGFLPIFLFGFYFNDIRQKFSDYTAKIDTIKINKVLKNKFANLSALILVLLLSAYVTFHYHFGTGFKIAYHAMGFSNLEGIILRLFVLISAVLIILTLFNLMTSKKTFLTKWGRNSLAIYILQFYFIALLPLVVKLLGLKFLFTNFITASLLIISISVIVTVILSSDRVNAGMNLMIKKFSSLILKPDSR